MAVVAQPLGKRLVHKTAYPGDGISVTTVSKTARAIITGQGLQIKG